MVNVIAKVNKNKSSILRKEKSRRYKKIMSKKNVLLTYEVQVQIQIKP
jgi:hypothetical protein